MATTTVRKKNLLVLAVVGFRKDDASHSWARLDPTHEARDGSWEPIVGRSVRLEKYPTEGQIYWPACPPAAAEGSAWTFSPEHYRPRHPSVGGKTDRDEFRAASNQSMRPPEVFMASRERSSRELRRQLAGSGILVPQRLPSSSVYVKLPEADDSWIGPIDFTCKESEGGVVACPRSNSQGFFPVREIPGSTLQELSINGARYLVRRPGSSEDKTPASYFNTQPDERLIAGLLRQLQRIGAGSAAQIGLSQQLLTEFMLGLEKAGLAGENAMREEARQEAAKLLLEQVEEDADAVKGLADSLIDHEKMQDLLRSAIKMAVESRASEIEVSARDRVSQIASQISEAENTLANLRQEIAEKSTELVQLESDLKDARTELARETDLLEEGISRKVDEILEDPVGKLAEHRLVNAMLAPQRRVKPHTDQKRIFDSEPGKRIEKFDSFRDKMVRAALEREISVESLQSCLASALSGRMALLMGDQAAEVAHAAAAILSGSNAKLAHVPTSIFGLDDLLSIAVAPADGSLDSATLGECLQAASEHDVVNTVVLHGVNRAPLETAVLDLAVARAVAPDETKLPWARRRSGAETTTVSFGMETVLIATAVNGKTTFGLTKPFRSRIFLIDTDAEFSPKMGVPGQRGSSHFVRAADWSRWWGGNFGAESDLENSSPPSPLAPANEREEGRERMAFSKVMHEQETNSEGHWLIARRGGLVDEEQLKEEAREIGPQAVEVIDAAAEQGVLGRMAEMTTGRPTS